MAQPLEPQELRGIGNQGCGKLVKETRLPICRIIAFRWIGQVTGGGGLCQDREAGMSARCLNGSEVMTQGWIASEREEEQRERSE